MGKHSVVLVLLHSVEHLEAVLLDNAFISKISQLLYLVVTAQLHLQHWHPLQVLQQVLLQAQLILIQLPAQLVAQSLQDLQLMLVAALVIIRLVVAVMATPSLLVVETNVSGFQMVPFPLVLVQQEMVNVLMHLTMDQITAAFLQLAKVAVPLLNVVSLKTQ